MIVKILGPSAGFEGINYSEKKNDQGKSELLQVENFGALGHGMTELNKIDYINYMKAVGGLNSRVKNKQFHATISTKERMHTPEQLRVIAVRYLNEMGYGNNPFLIYSHSDTQNNHVHVVSTRVTKEGKKVSDKYEKIRSQKVMQRILGEDPKVEATNSLKNVLDYNFSTHAQFKLLLEQMGYKTSLENDKYKLIKYGNVQLDYGKSLVDTKLNSYVSPDQRIKQLKAIFIKYKPGLNRDEFISFMKAKFGVDLIFHKNDAYNKPYGYSVIDHSNKDVLKGSQVMAINELLDNSLREEKINRAKEYIMSYIDKDSKYSQVKVELNKYGFKINKKGEIVLHGDNKPIYQLENDVLKILKYNDRVGEARKFSISNESERDTLSRVFFVKPEELTISPEDAKSKEYYKNLLNVIYDHMDLKEGLLNHNLKILYHNGDLFLIDQKERQFFKIKDLSDRTYDFSGKIDIAEIKGDKSLTAKEDLKLSQADPSNSLKELFGLLASMDFSGEDEEKNKKRKKHKI